MDIPRLNDKLILNRPFLEEKLKVKLIYKVTNEKNGYITIVPIFKYDNKKYKDMKIVTLQSGQWNDFKNSGWSILK